MSTDTSLSPRLRHLLIQEDRRTGKLILPDRSRQAAGSVSPPQSPEFTSPTMDRPSTTSSATLPPPRIVDDLRPSQSIFSLLNDLSVASLRSPPSTSHSGSISPHTVARRPSPTLPPQPITPQSAPLPGVRPPFFAEERQSTTQGPIPPRPDLFRRHSSHPYEYYPASQPHVAYRHVGYAPLGMGSRAPISRTTKACNACRARKVRCDAGGNSGGEPSTCSRCRESGVTCVYSGAQKKRGPCPGTTRPTIAARRRSSQRGSTGANPPDPIPTHNPYSSRSSYGYPPPHAYPPPTHHYHQPLPTHRAVPPPPPPHSAPHPTASGWPSHSQPLDSRRPTAPIYEASARYDFHDQAYGQPQVHPSIRKHSGVSWLQMRPATQADERRISFEPEYMMKVDDERKDERRASLFGDKGRQLPPLRMAIGGRSSYYEP